MAKQPVVGLGDVSFDPSLQTDEVDHDFFDNPTPLTDGEPQIVTTSDSGEVEEKLSEPAFIRGLTSFPLEPIRVLTDSYTNLNSSPEVFSTGTLLACLKSTENEAGVSVNSHQDRSFHTDDGRTVNVLSWQSGKKEKGESTRLKLFDISDSSSEASAGSDEESDEELNNFLEKYCDLLDVEDTDNSDFTEISPMSSLTVSPMPSFVGDAVEDFNQLPQVLNTNVQASSQSPSMETHLTSVDALAEPISLMISQLPKQLPVVISTSTVVPTSINSNLNTVSGGGCNDLNQNGDRSPSVSSCISACGSSNNSSSSLSVSSLSSKRSGSSASSSCGSACGRKSGRNYTFTPDQLKRIERENGILLKKIIDTQRHHHNHHHHGHRSSHSRTGNHRSIPCSASIARQKQQRRIEHENLLLMKKIQNVKPSREIGEAFKHST